MVFGAKYRPGFSRTEASMLDLVYLALGLGAFALFAGLAAALRRL